MIAQKFVEHLEVVGEALAPFREHVVIATKFGFKGGDSTAGLDSRPDIVEFATTIDEVFDECSPEQLDEMKRRLEFIQAEVEALNDLPPREVLGWITG
jgi:aryl-alcohol dehydrogenase-like predicted oxidoreductase